MTATAKLPPEAEDILDQSEKRRVDAANDWIADFSKKSQEALAKKAAEKSTTPTPDEGAVIEALARKSDIEYDKVRADVAETFGIRVGTLDDKVAARREALTATDKTGPAHWSVTPASEAVDGAALLDALRAVIRRYIMLPPGADVAIPLWIMHAWTHDNFEISPILCLTSPTKRCGKTSLMILLYYLTPRSELAANVSTASIFRYIEAEHPTLLVDEADSFLSASDEMRGILNSGHTKAGATVIRVEEIDGELVPKRFSTWAPKTVALIKALPETLADRSVIVRMMRRPKGVTVERLRKRDSDELRQLRARCARWAVDHGIKLIDADPSVPDTLHDRACDNWRALLAIADLAGGQWPALSRKTACDLSGAEEDSSMNVLLLADVRTAFGDDAVMRSIDLVTALSANPEKPWAEYNRGKPLTQRQLARMMGEFGVISVEVHPPGLSHGKGYKRVDLEPQWNAYCPPEAGQDDPSELPPSSQARERASADETGTTSAFSSARGPLSRGSKTANLAHSHAGLRVRADENPVQADEGGTDQELGGNAASGRPPACAFCGASDPAPNRVAFDGLDVWLHRDCEPLYLSEEEYKREIDEAIATSEAEDAAADDGISRRRVS